MLKILGRKNSSNVQKVLWCCGELDVPFEREDYGGEFGKTCDAAYLAMNPNARIPTIIDDDLVLWESNSILRYLANKHDDGKLYPKDPGERARGERWMDWQLAVLRDAIHPVFWGSSGPSRKTAICPPYRPLGKIPPMLWPCSIPFSARPTLSADHVSRSATYRMPFMCTGGTAWTLKGKTCQISVAGMNNCTNAPPSKSMLWLRLPDEGPGARHVAIGGPYGYRDAWHWRSSVTRRTTIKGS